MSANGNAAVTPILDVSQLGVRYSKADGTKLIAVDDISFSVGLGGVHLDHRSERLR